MFLSLLFSPLLKRIGNDSEITLPLRLKFTLATGVKTFSEE